MPAYLYYNPIDNDDTVRLYQQGLTDEEIARLYHTESRRIAKWRWRKGLPANIKPKPEDDGYAADIKKCRKCEYWRGANGNSSELYFCHHLLSTGKRRQQGEGKECLSYTDRLPKKVNKEMDYGAEDDFDQHAWEQDSGGY